MAGLWAVGNGSRCRVAAVAWLSGLAYVAALAPSASAVDRTWIGGNADWDAVGVGKWTGNDEPDTDDVAIFSTNNTVDMAISNNVMGLTLSGGIDLRTLTNSLTVGGDVSISGTSTFGVGGNNLVGVGANLLDAHSIIINNNAQFNVGGTRIDVADPGGANNGFYDINAGGTLYGNGTLDSNDVSTVGTFNMLINDGTLRVGNYSTILIIGGVPAAQTLSITSSDATNSRVDLDGGSGNGVVDILRNQTLDINVPLSDDFDGVIDLAHNATLDIEDPWSNGAGGVININAGFVPSGGIGFPAIPADTAFIDGGVLTNNGTININDDSTLSIDTGFAWGTGTIDNTDTGTLILNFATTLNNNASYLLGANSQTVLESTILNINDNDFNMDGSGGSDWTLRNGSELDIDADFIDVTNNGFDGTLTFEGTGANVVDINVANNSAQLDRIIVAANAEGEITSSANDNIQLQDLVTVNAGGILRLDSNVISFEGFGGLNGTGQVIFEDAVEIDDDTSFSVSSLDIDNANGSLRVNPDATLTITSATIESVNSIFTINGGTADVSTDYNFFSTGSLQLIEAFTTTNPVYTGTGTPTFFNNSSLISSSDGADFDSNGVFLEGSTIDLLSNNSRLTLGGTGKTIQLDGGDAMSTGTNTRLTLQGTLQVTGDSTIDVPVFDWDGGVTVVESGGTLTINADTVDVGDNVHNNTVTVNGGLLNVNTLSNTWTVDNRLNLNFDGTSAIVRGDRVLIGDDLEVNNADVVVDGGGISRIEAAVTFNSDADVFIEAGSELVTNNGGTIFTPVNGANNGRFEGTGKWRIVGAQFDETTTINMVGGEVALDGVQFGGIFAGDTDVNAFLNINVATFEDFGFTAAIGQSDLNIANAGRLTVNLDNAADDWRVLSNGIINYNGDASAGNFLAGNEIDLDGTLNVTGDGRSLAELTIGGTVNLLTGGDGLRLGNSNLDNTIDGGVVNGPGSLFADSGRILTGFGTINSTVDFDGNAELIANGGTLEVNGSIVDMRTLRANSGTLQLDSNLASSVTSNGISLDDGILTGSGTVTLDVRNLRGNGTVLSTVVNNNTIAAQGGTLIIDSPTANLDGTGSEDGIIRAQTGTLEIRDSANEFFNGVATVDNGRTMFFNGQNPFLAPDSVLNLDGGRFRTNLVANHQGTINVNANSEFQQDGASVGVFTSTTVINANATLSLDGTFNYNNGTTAAGGGSINILSGSNLRAIAGPTISTLLNNLGDLDLGVAADITTLTVQDYQQTASGSLNLDIEGTALSDYDRVSVVGTAFLDGTLDVDFQNGFSGSDGDSFVLLTFLGRVGEFDSLDVSGLGAGLEAVLSYTGTSAVLDIIESLIIEGDYNGDGFVSQPDLDLVLLNWGDGVVPGGFVEDALPGGGPFDGLMSQNELDGVLLNWGNGSPPVVAIPEPTTAALLVVLTGLMPRRRR